MVLLWDGLHRIFTLRKALLSWLKATVLSCLQPLILLNLFPGLGVVTRQKLYCDLSHIDL